jgi:hypothetical protein
VNVNNITNYDAKGAPHTSTHYTVKDHPPKDMPMQKNATLKSLNDEEFDIR